MSYTEVPTRGVSVPRGSIVLRGGVCKVHQACQVAEVYRDIRRVAGRKPYYGHVRHVNGKWFASVAGGDRVRAFKTRSEAKAWIADNGIWA